jgi:histone-binding protein RBBP4
VAWHQLHTTIFGSTSSEGELAVWDIRSQETTRPSHKIAAHKFSINSVEFNPFSEYLLATSSMDRSIGLWDLRNLKLKLHSIRVRDELLHRIRWSPHYSGILGACNNDRRIYLFDMDRIFEEQTPDDAEDGPSTLVFSHNGHTSPIYDLAWNPSDELMVCSISEDNVLQFWQVVCRIVKYD